MNLEEKKLAIIQMVITIESEEIIDGISTKIAELVAQNQAQEQKKKEEEVLREKEKLENGLPPRYSKGFSKEKFDLEKIMKEQNYTGIDMEKMDRLAKEANIEEPIEKLLEMLD